MIKSRSKWVVYPVNADQVRIGRRRKCNNWVWRNGELFSTRNFEWVNNRKRSHMRVDHFRVGNVGNPELWFEIRMEGGRPSFVGPGGVVKLRGLHMDNTVAFIVLNYHED